MTAVARILPLLLVLGCKKEPVDDTGLDTGDTADTADTADTSDTGNPDVVTCADPLPAPAEGDLCVVEGDPATATHVLLRGVVLGESAAYLGGGLLYEVKENATFTCTGCDCVDEAPEATLVVSCPEGVFSPGLVNSHDHTLYNLVKPKFPPGTERYDHRHDWRRGLRGHTELSASDTETRQALLYGELRMALGGATSIVGSISDVDGSGLLRNLDVAAYNEGLGDWEVDYRTFPLGDLDGTLRASGCGDYDIDSDSRLSNRVYLPHIAEGIDPEARNEFTCLSSDNGGGTDLIAGNTSVVHGIGLTPPDIATMAADGAKLVWSPRSNVHLYGFTADVVQMHNQGVLIALGTDWMPSGSSTMLRELACAEQLDTEHYGDHFSDRDLWRMATRNGAIASGAGGQLGVLAEGYVADVALFDGRGRETYRAVLDAAVDDVALVLRGGEVLNGDADLVGAMPGGTTGCEALDVCGRGKLVCVQRDAGITLASIRSALPASPYPLFHCDPPSDEPSCEPLRADEDGDGIVFPVSDPEDADGDGLLDAVDNCPTVFNPQRPVDDLVQSDWDGDGLGDSCDPCPLTTAAECGAVDPDDVDGDGVDDVGDNCPGVANGGQEDGDLDGIGDACDPCPDYANADGACLETVYDVKKGLAGGEVILEHLQVTAVGPDGVFLQLPPGQPGYAGADYSGIYAYMPVGTKPALGDRLTIQGLAEDYEGQIQISSVVAITPEASGQAALTPVVATPAEAATGGSRQAALEAVLVRVENVTVTSIAPTPGPDDTAPTNEFELAGGLRVNDLLHLVAPFPVASEVFTSISGVLRWSHGNSKLEPRSAADVVAGPPVISGFAPGSLALEAGAEGSVDVTLTRPAAAAVEVTLACAPSASLTCPASVTIDEGEQSAAIALTAGTAGDATITANLGDDRDVEMTVRVYDDATPRAVAGFTPAQATVLPGQTVTLVLSLDLPAPTGGLTVPLEALDGLVTPPSEVTFEAGQQQADVAIVGGDTDGTDTVEATLNGTVSATVVVRSVTVGTNVYFTQYMEGSSNNKAVEITSAHPTGVALGGCVVRVYSNGATTPTTTITLATKTLATGESHVVCHSSEDALGAKCQQETGSLSHNGDDALALVCNGEVVDVFGKIGEDPGSAWTAGGVTTVNSNLHRKCSVIQGDPDGTDAFDPSVEWTAGTMDDPSDLGVYVCE